MARIINAWHRDYAAEVLKSREKYGADGEFQFVKSACSSGNVLPLVVAIAQDLGDTKLAGIAATVAEIEAAHQAQGIRCRRKVTEAQRFVLATALLERYGSPRAIAAAAWGLTDEEIEAA
ncbi:MAG: hypothetical protein V4713_12175 [Pseudomonadota bacterium]